MKNNEHQEMTKEELEQIRTELRQSLAAHDHKMDQKMAKVEASIIRWFVGVFLAAVVVMGSLVGAYTMLLAGKAG